MFKLCNIDNFMVMVRSTIRSLLLKSLISIQNHEKQPNPKLKAHDWYHGNFITFDENDENNL